MLYAFSYFSEFLRDSRTLDGKQYRKNWDENRFAHPLLCICSKGREKVKNSYTQVLLFLDGFALKALFEISYSNYIESISKQV